MHSVPRRPFAAPSIHVSPTLAILAYSAVQSAWLTMGLTSPFPLCSRDSHHRLPTPARPALCGILALLSKGE
jgi:hypothetical protein